MFEVHYTQTIGKSYKRRRCFWMCKFVASSFSKNLKLFSLWTSVVFFLFRFCKSQITRSIASLNKLPNQLPTNTSFIQIFSLQFWVCIQRTFNIEASYENTTFEVFLSMPIAFFSPYCKATNWNFRIASGGSKRQLKMHQWKSTRWGKTNLYSDSVANSENSVDFSSWNFWWNKIRKT